jgi:mannose-6-phosphate isomerase-like protein (cupin superfamily)
MEIVNRDKVKPFITKDSSEVREILALKNQSLAEARVALGEATLEHYHRSSEEIYYILEGKGRIKIEDEIEKVEQGDGIAIPPGKRHRIWSTGEGELVFLCCCSPPYSDEDTVMVE